MLPQIAESLRLTDTVTIPLPDRLRPYVETITATTWGPVVLVSAPFADPYTNFDLASLVPTVDRDTAQQITDATGVIMHQPSKPVVQGIGDTVEKLGLSLPPIKFILGEIGRSNSSSATTLVVASSSSAWTT